VLSDGDLFEAPVRTAGDDCEVPWLGQRVKGLDAVQPRLQFHGVPAFMADREGTWCQAGHQFAYARMRADVHTQDACIRRRGLPRGLP
jgi:hypothetical protein